MTGSGTLCLRRARRKGNSGVRKLLKRVPRNLGAGLFFGYYPARRAARLPPAVAVRYD